MKKIILIVMSLLILLQPGCILQDPNIPDKPDKPFEDYVVDDALNSPQEEKSQEENDEFSPVYEIETIKRDRYYAESDYMGHPIDMENVTTARTDTYSVSKGILRENFYPDDDEFVNWPIDIMIEYPQIYNMDKDGETNKSFSKQQRINQILYREATGSKRRTDEFKEKEIGYFHLTYTVTLATSDILSVYFTGYSTSGRSGFICFGVTIDLKEEKLLDLHNLMELNETHTEEFMSSFKLRRLIPSTREYVPEEPLEEELAKGYLEPYEHTHSFYLRKDKLGIMCSTPASQDYTVFEAPYSSLRDCMKLDNPVWQSILSTE